jgi:hypothetical protein
MVNVSDTAQHALSVAMGNPASAAQIVDILDSVDNLAGVTATSSELNRLDGIGTPTAGKIPIGDGDSLVCKAVSGDLTLSQTGTATLATATKAIKLPLSEFRQVAAIKDALPDAADGTTLGLADTPGAPIFSSDITNDTATETAGIIVNMEPTYVAGGDVSVDVYCEMVTARRVTSTVHAELYNLAVDSVELPSDITETTATVLTPGENYAAYSFAVDATDLSPGDSVYLKLTVDCDDTDGTTSGAVRISGVVLNQTCKS